MVKGIIADAVVQGHLVALIAFFQTNPWIDLREELKLVTPTFADFGLAENTPNRLVWELCLREQLVLVTGNRNAEGPDSLEETLRTIGNLSHLPVITLATAERVLYERSYLERAGIRILDILTEIERYRGAGRLFAP